MENLSDATKSRVYESFSAQSLMQFVGARLELDQPGACRIISPIADAMRQQHGFGHAALTFALGDTAAGYAALSVMPDGHEVLTAEMKIQLLAPAQGDRLIADGKILRIGRRLIPVEADVWAESGDTRTRIAKLVGTMVPVAAT